MKYISIPIICLAVFMTTSLLAIRVLTWPTGFNYLYSQAVSSEPQQLELAYQLAQSIWDLSYLSTIVLPENEQSHLMDVHQVVKQVKRAATGLWIMGALLLTRIRISFRHVAAVNLIAISLLGLFIYTSWPLLFTLFHLVIFPQGNWAFPAGSILIQLYPDQFWYVQALVMMGFHATVYGAALLMMSFHRGHGSLSKSNGGHG